ncbi:MAG: LPS export ABC transporter ATP-binding protein [Planctomycetia bacterium]|nr:LPS export ABC transporter ATP-binding protein [Planctomycetia bacterium]
MLEVRGICKSIRGNMVVRNVDLDVGAGQVVGLLGENGAGKTTCFRMVCGLIPADAGRVTLGGHDVTRWPMYLRSLKGGMGYLPQESSIFRKLTVRDNLLAVMELLGFDARERKRRCAELLARFGLENHAGKMAMVLSGGLKRRLEIARALVSNPRIILLDEPFVGIDPGTVLEIQKIIRELRKQKISFLITDHNVDETVEIADRIYLLAKGEVACSGEPDYVRHHPCEAARCYFVERPASNKQAETTSGVDGKIGSGGGM